MYPATNLRSSFPRPRGCRSHTTQLTHDKLGLVCVAAGRGPTVELSEDRGGRMTCDLSRQRWCLGDSEIGGIVGVSKKNADGWNRLAAGATQRPAPSSPRPGRQGRPPFSLKSWICRSIPQPDSGPIVADIPLCQLASFVPTCGEELAAVGAFVQGVSIRFQLLGFRPALVVA